MSRDNTCYIYFTCVRFIFLGAVTVFGQMMAVWGKRGSMLYFVYSYQRCIRVTVSDLKTNLTYEHAPETVNRGQSVAQEDAFAPSCGVQVIRYES